MSASDFNSTNTPWTDDDTAGPSSNPTQNFALTAQDTGHIIPVIKDALAINPNLQIVASPWSAPAWMKDNNSMIGNTTGTPSKLLPQYYQAWADYFRKWIQAYQGQGIPIRSVTPQNEPLYSPTNYPGMAWDSAGEASWVHKLEMVAGWVAAFPVVSVEDRLDEEDWAGWADLTALAGDRVRLIGDDLFTTNPQRLARGIATGCANGVLIKVNQNRTLTGTLEVVRIARDAGYVPVVSARSGETEDDFLADLAVGARRRPDQDRLPAHLRPAGQVQPVAAHRRGRQPALRRNGRGRAHPRGLRHREPRGDRHVRRDCRPAAGHGGVPARQRSGSGGDHRAVDVADEWGVLRPVARRPAARVRLRQGGPGDPSGSRHVGGAGGPQRGRGGLATVRRRTRSPGGSRDTGRSDGGHPPGAGTR
jgi:hypothetical protein